MNSHFYLDCTSEQLIRSAQEEEQRIDRKRLMHSARFNQRSLSERIFKMLPGELSPDQCFLLTLFVEGRVVTGANAEIGWYHQGIEKVLESTLWQNASAVLRRINHNEGSALELAFHMALEKLSGLPAPSLSEQLRRTILLESERIKHHSNVIGRLTRLIGSSAEHDIRNQLTGRAKIDRNSAVSLGLSGIVLRASGFADDLRLSQELPYAMLELRPQLRIESDAYARFLLRRAEVEQSQALIARAEALLNEQPTDEAPPEFKKPEACNCAAAFVEAPEGEVMVALWSDGAETPYRVRIKTPSFALASATSAFLIGADIDDVVIILSSMGLQAFELDR